MSNAIESTLIAIVRSHGNKDCTSIDTYSIVYTFTINNWLLNYVNPDNGSTYALDSAGE